MYVHAICTCVLIYKHVCTLFRRLCTCLYKYIRVLTYIYHIHTCTYMSVTYFSRPTGRSGLTKLYEPFPTPWLYVAPAACMVGRVPLTPLFLADNSTPTIVHKYSQHKRSGYPVDSCDTAAADGRRGSNVYEVNPWLWQFGRGKQRLGGLSVLWYHRSMISWFLLCNIMYGIKITWYNRFQISYLIS